MAITDTAAIKFSNEHIRPSADRLARAYYRLVEINDLWEASQETNDQKVVLFGSQISDVAGRVSQIYYSVAKSAQLYDALTMQALFPNDPLEEVWDNTDNTAQDPNRPAITGEDVRRVKNRMDEFRTWMEKNDFDEATVNPLDYANLDSFLRIASDGAKTPTTNWFLQVAKTRADEMRLQYETTFPQHLSHLLRAAVNPNLP